MWGSPKDQREKTLEIGRKNKVGNKVLLDVIFATFFRFYVTKPPKKLPFNPLYTKYI